MKGQGISEAEPEKMGISALEVTDVIEGSLGNPIDLQNTGRKPVLVWFQEVCGTSKQVLVEKYRQIAAGTTVRFGIDNPNFLRLSLHPFSGLTAVRGGRLSANALSSAQRSAGLRPR